MVRSLSVLVSILGLSTASAWGQALQQKASPEEQCVPGTVTGIYPTVGPFPRAGENWPVGISKDWFVYSHEVNGIEEWNYYAHHIPTGTTIGTGLWSREIFASAAYSPDGGDFFQGVAETVDNIDRNGDGDWEDIVLHTYELATMTLVNTGLSVSENFVNPHEGPIVLFRVEETTIDENGDGDMDDWILYAGDLATGAYQSSSTASSSFRVQELWGEGSRAAFLVEEEPGVDYTGDGDFDDEVYYVHDFLLDVGFNLGLAHAPKGIVRLHGTALKDGVLAITVDEAAQGADLNGDSDQTDFVLHTFDFSNATLTNRAVAAAGPEIESGFISFENTDTGTAHLLELSSGNITDFGVTISGVPTIEGDFVFFEGVESAVDWNGDGDMDDHVLWIHDLVQESTFHVGAAIAETPDIASYSPTFDLSGSLVLFPQDEAAQGDTDLNGDADATDVVWTLYDLDDGSLTSLGFAAGNSFFRSGGLYDGIAYLEVNEANQGVDLNGDSNLFSEVLMIVRLNGAQAPRVFDANPGSVPELVEGLGLVSVTNYDLNGDTSPNEIALIVFEACED